MDKFKSFLEEQKGEKYKILVISSKPKESEMFHTATRFADEGKALGHEVYIVQVENAYIRFEDGAYYVHNAGDKKGFEISANDTVAFVRGSVRLKKSWLDILSQLEKVGVCMVNSRETVELTSDKYRTYLKLMDFGLTQPKTVLIPNKDGVKEALEALDSEFPIIMKTLEGSKGIGVLFVESERSLTSLVQLLFNQDEESDLLIQEFKKTEYDVRVIVLGGKVIAAMERGVVKGDFRSNVSQGAEVKGFDLTELEIEQSLLASKAVDGAWAAVDFIPSEDREKEPPYILEVNHSPGTAGVEKATKMNIVKSVVEYYADPKNRYSVPTQCGYYETLDIKPFGPLVAKFDTGNSVHNVLHAEDVKVSGKKISFKLNGKRISTKLQGTYTSITGGGEDERYIVKLDCNFGGTDYPDIEFGLDDRSRMGTDVLLDRDIMTRFNVVVNPNRKYVITTKFVINKDT
jgi:RimK family alpha-L-glutamate ligase